MIEADDNSRSNAFLVDYLRERWEQSVKWGQELGLQENTKQHSVYFEYVHALDSSQKKNEFSRMKSRKCS